MRMMFDEDTLLRGTDISIDEDVDVEIYDGRALESYLHMRPFLQGALNDVRNQVNSVGVLDYGTGHYGVGRAIFESLVRNKPGHLYLYDPHTSVEESARNDIDVIPFYLDPLNHKLPNIDIINLSYVLCCMDRDEAEITLKSMRMAYPQATLTVIEYILAGRGDVEVLHLLDTNQERMWQQQIGEERFLETRRSFSQDSLSELLESTSYNVHNLELLDDGPYRIGIVAKPTDL
jgi:hypothetical protein